MAKFAALLAMFLLCVRTAAAAAEFDASFWVWQRNEPLSENERTELLAQGVRTIYWHVGELENVGETWHWKQRFSATQASANLRIVPVVRLTSREKFPFAEKSLAALLVALSDFEKNTGAAKSAGELQLDFDCPDRLLGDYAQALKKIRAQLATKFSAKLSITALPGWSRKSELRDLQASVDELLPMFYDFEIDPLVQNGAAPLPLIDPQKIQARIAEWDNACKTSVWNVGLPAFARVTIYDAGGKSRGHIRDAWLWDEICFNSALATMGPTQLGVTLFRASKMTRIAQTPIRENELVAARWPDRAALREAFADAKKTSASGVVFFRLPDAMSDASGWSLRQLGHLDAVAPRLVLRKTNSTQQQHQLELCNDSNADLEPRLSGSGGELDRGYALEIDAPAPIFREALEGDFARVTGHANPDTKPRAVAIPLATRLTFWFSHLRARESLRTGLIQLAPGTDLTQIRWHILDIPRSPQWKKIE